MYGGDGMQDGEVGHSSEEGGGAADGSGFAAGSSGPKTPPQEVPNSGGKSGMGWRLKAVAARIPKLWLIVAFLSILAVYFYYKDFSWYLVGIPEFAGDPAQGAEFSEAQVAAISDTLVTLLTFLIGQFLVVGAVLRDGFSSRVQVRGLQLIAVLAFAVVLLHAGSFLYLTRIVLLQQIAYGVIDVAELERPIAAAAKWTSIGFFVTAFMGGSALAYNENRDKKSHQ